MTPVSRMTVIAVLVTALAAAAGGWAGIQYGLQAINPSPSLDDIIHDELHLTADQEQRIEIMESKFAIRRYELENEMRAANTELATAITSQPISETGAQAAIEKYYLAEKALQEETVQHVLMMRELLTVEQKRRFDEAITTALNSD